MKCDEPSTICFDEICAEAFEPVFHFRPILVPPDSYCVDGIVFNQKKKVFVRTGLKSMHHLQLVFERRLVTHSKINKKTCFLQMLF
jgi:hypothetical protein